jgi:hypothetical protein
MEKKFSLNELYVQYSAGILNKKKFEGLIFQTIISDARRFNQYRWKEDDYNDFVSWLYPRVSRAIDAYRYRGSSFETYIGSLIRWAAKEYRFIKTDNEAAEYISWAVRAPDLYACQIEPEYPEHECVLEEALPRTGPETKQPASGNRSGTRRAPKKNSRRLLILILKCYYYISDDFLERIAPLAGIEKDRLKEMIDQLRNLRLKRDEALRCMRERVYSQFFRCIIYEKRLAAMPENSAAYIRTRARLLKARERLTAMRKRLASVRPGATNRQIAEVIGVAKGTVDSTLHALKSRWNDSADISMLN